MTKRDAKTSTTFDPSLALITGASAGLGRQISLELARRRVGVILVARNLKKLNFVKTEIEQKFPEVNVEVLPADLATPEGIDSVRERLQDRKNPVELLVNNAGFGLKSTFHESSLQDERQLAEVLVWAPLALSHAVLPIMRERQRGWIINVASLAGLLPSGSYAAAKAHTIMLSRSLRAEYARDNIVVSALLPGFVRTEFHERMGLQHTGVPWFAWANARTVAREALTGVARGKAIVVSDFRYRIVRPLIAVIPDSVIDRFNVLHARTRTNSFN